jgi:hypothetical protein
MHFFLKFYRVQLYIDGANFTSARGDVSMIQPDKTKWNTGQRKSTQFFLLRGTIYSSLRIAISCLLCAMERYILDEAIKWPYKAIKIMFASWYHN